MTDKEHVCAYKYCLHHGEKVKASNAVVINKKYYHWDCAAIRQEIQDCASTYIGYVDDKSQYPMAIKAINTLVFKNKVPIDYIRKNIESSKYYYANKPAYVLYGIRKMFWEKEFKA